MNTRFDAVVAGAGLVGAAAALALARRGFEVALIEAAADAAPARPQAGDAYDLRVSAISPESQAILGRLDVWPRLDPGRVCFYERMQIWHQHGVASVGFDAVELARDHLGAIVENGHLLAAMHEACAQVSGIEWLRPDSVEELLANDGGRVELRLSSGRYLEAGLLLAADGRDSPTRRLAGIDAQAGSYRQRAIVANVDTEFGHEHTAWQRFLATGPLAFLPLANGQSSIVWSCDEDAASDLLAGDDAAFCAALGEAFEHRLGRVTACSPRRAFPLGWHRCERWLDGRVLLIGDAAHGVHPLAGQGVNLGFSDVDCLAGLLNGPAPDIPRKSLRRYERRRKSDTWLATQGFSGLKWLYGLEAGAATRLRDLGMFAVDKTPWIKRTLMRKAIRNLT